MEMTENEKQFWLDSDNGIRPYLRQKDNGMPKDKINQIAWLLLCSSGCGFCKVCRDEPCNIKDEEKCTTNIANYIRQIALKEAEQKIKSKVFNELGKNLINRIDEERELSCADFSKYVNDYSLDLDSEYDDFYHFGLARATELIKQIIGEQTTVLMSDRK